MWLAESRRSTQQVHTIQNRGAAMLQAFEPITFLAAHVSAVPCRSMALSCEAAAWKGAGGSGRPSSHPPARRYAFGQAHRRGYSSHHPGLVSCPGRPLYKWFISMWKSRVTGFL
jgi:hypothetical protein